MLARGRMKEQAGHGDKNVSSGEESTQKEYRSELTPCKIKPGQRGKPQKFYQNPKTKRTLLDKVSCSETKEERSQNTGTKYVDKRCFITSCYLPKKKKNTTVVQKQTIILWKSLSSSMYQRCCLKCSVHCTKGQILSHHVRKTHLYIYLEHHISWNLK